MRFLIVDDNPADRELISRCLRQAFPDVELVEVGDSDRFARALDEGGFDLILTDYLMGWTDGLAVLREVQERMPDMPVVMVTGSGSEEVAVEGMKAGLSDYVLKRHLERLAFSVREVLEKVELRRSKDRLQHLWQAERALRESEKRYRLLFQNIRESLAIFELVRDAQGEIVDWTLLDANPAALDTIGRPLEEVRGVRATELFGVKAMADLIARSREVVASGTAHREELYFPWNDRYYLTVEFSMDEQLYAMAGMDITERIRLERERERLLDKNLRQAAELETTIEAIADPVLFYRPDGTIARLNRSARRLLGYTLEEQRRPILDRARTLQMETPEGLPLPPDDLPALRALRGERLAGYPMRFRLGPEGRWVTALTSAAPVTGAGGEPLGAVVVLTDVTELMRVHQELEGANVELEVALEEMRTQEEALREAERRYRELVRYAPAGIYEIDFREQRFTSVNEAMCLMTGYSCEELLTMDPFDMLDEEGRVLFRTRIAKWLDGEEPDSNVEFRVRTKDGRTIDVLLNVTFIADEAGKPLGATVVAHDVTERKRADAERERLLAERTAIMESMADGLTLADPEGRVIYHNPASLSLHGYSSMEEALLAKDQVVKQWEILDLAGELVPVEDWPMLRALRGDTFSDYELCVRCIDTGKEFIGNYSGTLVRDSAGVPLVAMLTVRDVTDRKWAEEALARRTEELELLNCTTQALVGTAELDDILETVLQQLHASLRAAAASAWLIDSTSGELVCRRAVGPECKTLEDHRLVRMEGLTGWVAQHGQSLVVPDVADNPLHVRAVDQPGEVVMQSFLAVPMFVKGKRIGVLRVVDSRAGRFDEAQRALAESIAAVTAVAIERAQLYEQAREEAEVRSALLREINHRVKNNLSAIVGLLYAERRRPGVSDNPECNRVIDDLIQRVRGLATVHAMLSARGWRSLRLSDLALEVITSAIEALKDGRTFSLEVSPSPVRVTAAQAHHLALLLNELGTNTLKHGADEEGMHIQVEIEAQEGEVLLRYRDDGPGYPQEIVEGEGYSIGLDLARSMVQRGLRGELELSNNGGAVAVVRFVVDVDVERESA
jgi:PAS domain S-box-containing protein